MNDRFLPPVIHKLNDNHIPTCLEPSCYLTTVSLYNRKIIHLFKARMLFIIWRTLILVYSFLKLITNNFKSVFYFRWIHWHVDTLCSDVCSRD